MSDGHLYIVRPDLDEFLPVLEFVFYTIFWGLKNRFHRLWIYYSFIDSPQWSHLRVTRNFFVFLII